MKKKEIPIEEQIQDCGNGVIECRTFSKVPHKHNCVNFRGELPIEKLQLADVVDLGGRDGYSYATVKQIRDNTITFFRPYVQTADFSYTGGVICYIGFEEFTLPLNHQVIYKVVSRTKLK